MNRKIRYSSDCSGIEAPLFALHNLGYEVEHVFSSDIDQFAKKALLANWKPQKLYNDIYEPKDFCGPIDLYCAGFPCQSFSSIGKRGGTEDPRGQIYLRVLEIIEQIKPANVILENVRGIIKTVVFTEVTEKLRSLGYNVFTKVLNTKDYGIPQSRPRVYIVATKGLFEFPQKYATCRSISEFIDNSDSSKSKVPVNNPEILERLKSSRATFLNLGFWNFNDDSYEEYSPCVTASSTHWNVKKCRKATVNELLMLQGFPTSFNNVCSYTQTKKQIGNAMSVNVLEAVLENLLR